MAAPRHVIVLMLENRSFDNLLGYLDTDHSFEGLRDSPAYSHLSTTSAPCGWPKTNKSYYNVHNGVKVFPDYITPVDVPHSHGEIMEQLYRPLDDEVHEKSRNSEVQMGGFASTYARRCKDAPWPVNMNEWEKTMHCFDPHRVPVISTLAKEFAFSDCWYSSLPGPTAPNRQFFHSGTSRGQVKNSGRPQSQPTFFDLLNAAKRDWKVYFHDVSTCLTFTNVLKDINFNNHFSSFEHFEKDLQKETFPDYCFIEPRVFDDPVNQLYSNDQHPPHDLRRGEALIARIYEALRSSKHWEQSLFIILYDEHGGYWDHVAPPTIHSLKPADIKTNIVGLGDISFDFSQLGPRIPAVFVSPLIPRRNPPVRPREKGQYFVHESVILTLIKMWGLNGHHLEWQHDPSQMATFEWLWDDPDIVELPKAKEAKQMEDKEPEFDLWLPKWEDLERASLVYPNEGMEPYSDNYEIVWAGWAEAAAIFLSDVVKAHNPQIQKWCENVKMLKQHLSHGKCLEGFQQNVTAYLKKLKCAKHLFERCCLEGTATGNENGASLMLKDLESQHLSSALKLFESVVFGS